MAEIPETESLVYSELCSYTLNRGDPEFIHQHVADAFAAQYADVQTKPIQLVFALVGLYLHVEKTLTGREVQDVHQRLAQVKRQWPVLSLPERRGEMTPHEIITVPPGSKRDTAIHQWCASVWSTFADSRQEIIDLLRECNIE